MSLQRRLMLYLLACAPVVWCVALLITVDRARHEIDELYDTELVRLARQVQATLPDAPPASGEPPRMPLPRKGAAGTGEADLRDLAIAVWDRQGRLMLADREGVDLRRLPDASGFVDAVVNRQPWRIYYLQSPGGQWLVAAGQKAHERNELIYALTFSQLLPWVLVLPVLLAVMAWAVRRALAPLYQLTSGLAARQPDDFRPVPGATAPVELRPLVEAMNGLFARIEAMLLRERRFTADAAHELRTPLAVLTAQWDVVRRAQAPAERAQAEARFGAGLQRMDRLVTQMLALSKVESVRNLPAPVPVDWTRVVEEAVDACLAVAERRGIALSCDWPEDDVAPLPLVGDPGLLAVLLRNLLDNGVRYAPAGSAVAMRVGADRLEVENDGPALTDAQRAAMGRRFARADGQAEAGSGLGVSIVQRIAELHGLELAYGSRADGTGVRATVVRRAGAAAGAALNAT
ncbi:MAG: sensor histidine kinase N-terminal domain-containing protein [Xylophilus ampelinus]